jgi:hypothetical protein
LKGILSEEIMPEKLFWRIKLQGYLCSWNRG